MGWLWAPTESTSRGIIVSAARIPAPSARVRRPRSRVTGDLPWSRPVPRRCADDGLVFRRFLHNLDGHRTIGRDCRSSGGSRVKAGRAGLVSTRVWGRSETVGPTSTSPSSIWLGECARLHISVKEEKLAESVQSAMQANGGWAYLAARLAGLRVTLQPASARVSGPGAGRHLAAGENRKGGLHATRCRIGGRHCTAQGSAPLELGGPPHQRSVPVGIQHGQARSAEHNCVGRGGKARTAGALPDVPLPRPSEGRRRRL